MFKNSFKIITVLSALSLILIGCSATPAQPPITDIVWQWSQLVETNPAAQSLVPTPENFTIFFDKDGTFGLKADCNVGGGEYALDGELLTIGAGPLTMMYCGEQSLDTLFLTSLSEVESFSIENGELTMFFQNDGGSMVFIAE